MHIGCESLVKNDQLLTCEGHMKNYLIEVDKYYRIFVISRVVELRTKSSVDKGSSSGKSWAEWL